MGLPREPILDQCGIRIVAEQTKRREIYRSIAYWVEIDLLRAEELGPGALAGLPSHEYAVIVSKAGDKRRHGLIWTIRLNQRLPTLSIP